MKSICFITNKYPNLAEPSVLVFLQQLVWSMADKGIKCTVISPMPTNIYPQYKQQPYHTTETTENGAQVDVYWPRYVGFGDEHQVLGIKSSRITVSFFTRAVEKTIRKEQLDFDIVYAHFLEPAGVAAARIGKTFNKPSYVAYGEATFFSVDCYGENQLRKEFQTLTGVVAVATRNKQMLIERKLVSEDKIGVFPNGFRPERFYPRDKIESRNKFGFPQDAFIVGFVGSFDNRKGSNRLSNAVDHIDDCYAAFAGKGGIVPQTTKALWKESVKNENLPWFYSACDVFALPTLFEGCCNAIIEAMACGLPIISSDRAFNDDILDDTCSIRINPESEKEIEEAIRKLKENKLLLSSLGQGSLKKSKQLTLDKRAEKIYDFIFNKAMN